MFGDYLLNGSGEEEDCAGMRELQPKERAIRIIKNVIKKYDGIFDPTADFDARMMAEHIVKNLISSGLLEAKE